MKLALSVLFIVCSFSSLAQTRLRFERMPSMPHGLLAFGYAANEDELYAYGGSRGDQSVNYTLYIYNVNIEDWISVPLKKFPAAKYLSSIYLKNHRGLLVAGGVDRYGSTLRFREEIKIIYDERFKVRTLGPLPEPAKGLAMVEYEEIVYLLGGAKKLDVSPLGNSTHDFTNRMYSYDLTTGAIDSLAPMPVAMETVAAAVDGKIYTFGGFNGEPLADIWQYDIKRQTWSSLPPLKNSVSQHALVQYKHYVILVGGHYDTDRLVVYNTRNHTAAYFKTNTGGRHAGAAILGNHLHVYGGFGNADLQQHYRISLDQIIPKTDQ